MLVNLHILQNTNHGKLKLQYILKMILKPKSLKNISNPVQAMLSQTGISDNKVSPAHE